jgi:hypothetical protein
VDPAETAHSVPFHSQAAADAKPAGGIEPVIGERRSPVKDSGHLPIISGRLEECNDLHVSRVQERVPIDGRYSWTATFDSYDQRNDHIYYIVVTWQGESEFTRFRVRIWPRWDEDSARPGFVESLRQDLHKSAIADRTNTSYVDPASTRPERGLTTWHFRQREGLLAAGAALERIVCRGLLAAKAPSVGGVRLIPGIRGSEVIWAVRCAIGAWRRSTCLRSWTC